MVAHGAEMEAPGPQKATARTKKEPAAQGVALNIIIKLMVKCNYLAALSQVVFAWHPCPAIFGVIVWRPWLDGSHMKDKSCYRETKDNEPIEVLQGWHELRALTRKTGL